MYNIPGYIFFGIVLILGIVCGIRFMLDQFSPVKTVTATVVHKQTVDLVTMYSSTRKRIRYAVTFRTRTERLSFYVSELSYRHYKLNETATLKYKGRRLIDFS